MLGRVGIAGVAVSLLVGCTTTPSPTPSPAPPEPSWVQVDLPSGVRASAVAVAGDALLVGGFRGSGAAGGGQTPDDAEPSLLVLRDGTVDGRFDLRPSDPYAKVADLESLTVSGDEVFAIGKAVGGAHANPRLTVWDGSLRAHRLTSRPQEFFTFGGHDAGPLLGTQVVDGTAVIFGSRVGTTGTYGLLWKRSGHTWTQQPAAPALTSSPDREFGFGAVTRSGSSLVVAGDELGLAGGLTQRPLAFVGTGDGDWVLAPLPVPDNLPPVAGQLTRATSVACPPEGGTCWVSGWVHGYAMAWPLDLHSVDAPTVGQAALLPGSPPAGNDPATLVVLADGRPVVFTNATTPSVQVACPSGWRTLGAPAGQVTAAATVAGSLYAVAADRLWRLAVPSCG